MGGISAGVGLISGIDTTALIEQLLAVESRIKFPIQARIARLSTAKSALLDINSRLLTLQGTASAFRTNDIFNSVLATSSNSDALGVTASGSPQPGSYAFIVKRLASSSQFLSHGFSTRDSTPLGLDTLGIELGNGRLTREQPLSELNGGDGVQRGRFKITDRSGATAEIDLSDATSLNEVIDAINSASGISVSASIDGNGLSLEDFSGGSGTLTVVDGVGNSTASDLGIAGTSTSNTLVGTDVNVLGMNTTLSSLNDDRGVLIRDSVTDFTLTVDGNDFNIDLGRVDSPITGETLLSKLNNGDGVSINDDPEQGDFTIVSSTGVSVTIDLGRVLDEDGLTIQDEVETVQDLIDRVNGALTEEFGAGGVTMTLNADANGFVMNDTLGGPDELRVEGEGIGGDSTAEDLGIFGTAVSGTLQGDVLRNEVQTARATTIGDLAQRVNSATGGRVFVNITSDGQGIEFDASGFTIALSEGSPGFTGDAADIPARTLSDLGFVIDGSSGTTLSGERILSGLGTSLISGLNGGSGIGTGDSLTITDTDGGSVTLTGLSFAQTMSELIEMAQDQIDQSSVQVDFGLDPSGSSLQVKSLNSSNSQALAISGDLASGLGLNIVALGDVITGSNLELQYVTQSTQLSDMNYGRGIGTGSFRLTDSTGATATVQIGKDVESLYEVMKLINTRGLQIRAEINANGDGLELIDTTTETGTVAVSKMKVEDLSGTVANGLRISGESETVGGLIDGSYSINVDLDPTDTIDDLIAKLAEANAPISATVLNTGDGNKPWFLSMTSDITGAAGDLVINTGGVDLGLDQLVQGQDAQAFIGSDDPASGLLVSSSTNEMNGVIEGVSLDLKQAGPDPITVKIERDDDSVVAAVKAFTDAFNEAISRIDEYDSYDSENEVRGPLLGDSTAGLVRTRLFSTLQQKAQDVDGPYQYLSQVGIRLGSSGEIEFDEDKFLTAYQADPSGMESLFNTFDSQTTTSEVLGEADSGITVEVDSTVYVSLGFGDLFDRLLEDLTDPTTGTVTLADERFQTQIDSQNDRITQIDQRLEAKREKLQREFLAMETALAQLQGQQGALLSMGGNLGF
jgi:flagellar hook-associated protein 2